MLSEICTQIENLVMRPTRNLDDLLVGLLLNDGGRKTLPQEVSIFEIYNFNGLSGYNYWIDDTLIGILQIGNLQGGGFIVYRRIYKDNIVNEFYEVYNSKGEIFQTLKELSLELILYQQTTMEIGSPIINHFYNILNVEYERAIFGNINTKEVLFMENFLQTVEKNPAITIGINSKAKDQALLNINDEILLFEEDPVLKLSERQNVQKNLKAIKSKIIKTKKRAHKLTFLNYTLFIFINNFVTNLIRIKRKPGRNIRTFLYRNTIGHVLWFCRSVRDNLGYSIALAIYGPFTFYFITQPMNPHAMWAVGKVRDAYLRTVDSIETVIGNKLHFENSNSIIADNVNESLASTDTNSRSRVSPSHLEWEKRMSKFKAMQIGYEGDMVFAARIGRIEQLENQYNFTLTVDSLWRELKRYEKGIKSTLSYDKNLDHRLKSYLKSELDRITEYKFWSIERLSQFFLDHPYISVDVESEQTQKDIYTSHGFMLYEKMAKELLKEYPNRKLPGTHENIGTLSSKYKELRVADNTIIGSLKKNSKIFKQNDIFNSAEYRSYMKRHWEILFLQQNKKQEASSFGLQSYTWSVRNALWLMQTIISTKREELSALAYKFNLDNKDTAEIKANPEDTRTYEVMFEFFVTEYTGVKKEFAEIIKDREVEKREKIVNLLWKSFEERDGLFNATSGYSVNKTAKN